MMNLDISQLKEFYKKYKLIIWPVIVGVSCLLIALLVVTPQLLVYFNLRSSTQELENRLGVLQAKAQDLEQIDSQNNLNNLKLALAALPADKQVPQALSLLQNFIIQSNLTLENIKFSSNTETSGGVNNSFQVSITVLGSMDSIKRLLLAIHNSPRIFNLASINSQSIRTSNLTETDLSLQVFYEANASNLGQIDQPVPKLTDNDQRVLAEIAAKVKLSATASASFNAPLGKSDPFQ